MPTAKLPSGAPVHAFGSMGDVNHTPEVCTERAAYLAANYKVGDIVKRDDGCHVLINVIGQPSCGGYVEAKGQRVDMHTGELSSGWCGYTTGSLARCTVVQKPASLHTQPSLRQGC